MHINFTKCVGKRHKNVSAHTKKFIRHSLSRYFACRHNGMYWHNQCIDQHSTVSHARKQLCCFGLHNSTGYSCRTWLFPRLLMPWLTALPDNHRPLYCQRRINLSLSFCEIISTTSTDSRKDGNWKYIFMFPRNNSAHNGFLRSH